MISRAKHILASAALLVGSTVFALVLVEAGYRAYIATNVEDYNPFTYEPRENPTVSIHSGPGLWIYNADYGWDYNPEGYRSASVSDGEVQSCGTVQEFNSRGNIAMVETDFDGADVRIALIGSSYTMGKVKDRFDHEILGELISKRLKRNVLVENFSRDSFGVIQMMDMAAVVARDYQPDLLIIAFNAATIAMPRHWRTVIPGGDGFYRFYQVNEPRTEGLTKRNSRLHEYVISDLLTSEWCERMTAARKRGETALLRNDPLVKEAIARYRVGESHRQRTDMDVDFTSLERSFLYNLVKHENPLHGMRLYDQPINPIQPLTIRDYQADPKFEESLEALRAAGIPYQLIYIPSYPDLKEGRDWAALGTVGVPADQELALVQSLERATGKRILSLLPGLGVPREDADSLARVARGPKKDWHPSEKGVTEFVNVIADLLVRHHFVEHEDGAPAVSNQMGVVK